MPSKNDIVLLVFFCWKMHEMASFFPQRAVSFKWELVPKCVNFQANPSICARFVFWSLVSDFFHQVPDWPSNFNIYAIKPLI